MIFLIFIIWLASLVLSVQPTPPIGVSQGVGFLVMSIFLTVLTDIVMGMRRLP